MVLSFDRRRYPAHDEDVSLTPKERELLRLLDEHQRIVNPTARQLQRLMNFKSPGSVSALFRSLRAKGYRIE